MACFVLREWPLQLSRKSRHKGGEGRGGGEGSTQDEKKREREKIVKVGPLHRII